MASEGTDGPTAHGDMVDAKVSQAEDHVGLLRTAIVLVNAFVYLALMDHGETRVWLASTIIGLSVPYAFYVWLAKPYHLQRSVFWSAEALAITDGVLVGGWVLATGGFDSPFFVLWYAAIAAVGYRFDLRQVLFHATGYTALYLGVLAAAGDLSGHGAALTIRVLYIPIVGAMSGLLSSSYMEEIRARYATKDRLRRERVESMGRAHRALRDQEEKWRSILTNSPDLVIVVTREGRVEYVNHDAPGFDKAAMEGTNVREHVPEPFRARLEDGLTKAFQEGEVAEFETMGRGEDGQPRWYAARVGPITWGGQTTGAAIVTTDITERKRAEEDLAAYARQLAEHAQELERSTEELSHYAELAAHDLQEPLRDVTRYVQLLEVRYADQLDDQAQEYIETAVSGARRMHDLLNELLHYSQLRTSKLDLRPVDTGALLDNVLAEETPRLGRMGAEIDLEKDLPTVLADPAQLRIVFQHLVLNGLTYNESETPRVEVTAERVGDRWELRFTDNGIGIEPRHQARIFEPFKRLHTRQRFPGTGMGLSICQRVLEAHGGSIRVDSTPGEGSTFIVALPPAVAPRGVEHQVELDGEVGGGSEAEA